MFVCTYGHTWGRCVQAHMWGRRCTPTAAHRPLTLNTFPESREKSCRPSDARRLSVCVSLCRRSIQPVLSLAVIDGEVFVLLSKRFRDATGHKMPPPTSQMQIHHHHDKCHHLCHFNSLICLAPCLHLSACFNRAPPGLLKTPFKAGAAARGKTHVPAE